MIRVDVETRMPPATFEELRALLKELGYEAVYGRPVEERGVQVGLVVLLAVAERITSDAAEALARLVAHWVRERLRRRGHQGRASVRVIYGAEGEILAEVEVAE